jgi:hypothetical protein
MMPITLVCRENSGDYDETPVHEKPVRYVHHGRMETDDQGNIRLYDDNRGREFATNIGLRGAQWERLPGTNRSRFVLGSFFDTNRYEIWLGYRNAHGEPCDRSQG